MSKELVIGLLRHSLTFAGALAIGLGYMDEQMVAEATGAVISLFSIGWFVTQKLKG